MLGFVGFFLRTRIPNVRYLTQLLLKVLSMSCVFFIFLFQSSVLARKLLYFSDCGNCATYFTKAIWHCNILTFNNNYCHHLTASTMQHIEFTSITRREPLSVSSVNMVCKLHRFWNLTSYGYKLQTWLLWDRLSRF